MPESHPFQRWYGRNPHQGCSNDQSRETERDLVQQYHQVSLRVEAVQVNHSSYPAVRIRDVDLLIQKNPDIGDQLPEEIVAETKEYVLSTRPPGGATVNPSCVKRHKRVWSQWSRDVAHNSGKDHPSCYLGRCLAQNNGQVVQVKK